MYIYLYICCRFNIFTNTENGNGKLPFVVCKRNRKTEVCFPWLVNDKR